MSRLRVLTVLTALGVVLAGGMSAQAGYVVTLEQQGTNVVASGSGPIDVTGLSKEDCSAGCGTDAAIVPFLGAISTGFPLFDAPSQFYDGGVTFTGPTSIGSGDITHPHSSTGDIASLDGRDKLISVPFGYVSGGPLSDTATYDNQTFASLGVIPGVYEWTWGTGMNQNFTLDAVAATVPEPSSVVLLGVAFAALLLVRPRNS